MGAVEETHVGYEVAEDATAEMVVEVCAICAVDCLTQVGVGAAGGETAWRGGVGESVPMGARRKRPGANSTHVELLF